MAFLEGHTKDIDVLTNLRRLTNPTLRSITLPDLSLLTALQQLQARGLKLCGTRRLDLLPHVVNARDVKNVPSRPAGCSAPTKATKMTI